MDVLKWVLSNATSIESVAKTLALVAGGVWVFWKFSALLEKQKAKLSVEKLLLDFKQFARLEFAIIPTYLGAVDGVHFVRATVQVSNSGNRAARAYLPKPTDPKTRRTALLYASSRYRVLLSLWRRVVRTIQSKKVNGSTAIRARPPSPLELHWRRWACTCLRSLPS